MGSSQDSVLLGDTVQANARVRLGAATRTQGGRGRAANADLFITKSPYGYETMLGERGTRLRAASSNGSPSRFPTRRSSSSTRPRARSTPSQGAGAAGDRPAMADRTVSDRSSAGHGARCRRSSCEASRIVSAGPRPALPGGGTVSAAVRSPVSRSGARAGAKCEREHGLITVWLVSFRAHSLCRYPRSPRRRVRRRLRLRRSPPPRAERLGWKSPPST